MRLAGIRPADVLTRSAIGSVNTSTRVGDCRRPAAIVVGAVLEQTITPTLHLVPGKVIGSVGQKVSALLAVPCRHCGPVLVVGRFIALD